MNLRRQRGSEECRGLRVPGKQKKGPGKPEPVSGCIYHLGLLGNVDFSGHNSQNGRGHCFEPGKTTKEKTPTRIARVDIRVHLPYLDSVFLLSVRMNQAAS